LTAYAGRVQQLYGRLIEPEMSSIKTNAMGSMLGLVCSKLPCESKFRRERRYHTKNVRAVFFKINVEAGTYYQSCFKAGCAELRPRRNRVPEDLLIRLRCICDSDEFEALL